MIQWFYSMVEEKQPVEFYFETTNSFHASYIATSIEFYSELSIVNVLNFFLLK